MTSSSEPAVTKALEIPCVGAPPKIIREFVGQATTGDDAVSVAVMSSPPGWTEPAQTPEFDEYTVVLSGALVVHHDTGSTEVRGGQAVTVRAGNRVRYETPEGAEYVAVCLPAFTPDRVNREPEG